MADLIDRQAAIDALGGNEPVGDPSKMDDDDVAKMWERIRIINIINKLPSAQPDITRDNDCNGCKFVGCYDTDFPCANCVRKDKDYYEPEG